MKHWFCWQGLVLIEQAQPLGQHEPLPRMLPDLSRLKNLTALNLCENKLTAVPAMLSMMTSLQFLDLSANELMKVAHSLLLRLAYLQIACLQPFERNLKTPSEGWNHTKF